MEEWRPALGFDRYMVSNQGRVFDLKRSRYVNVRTNTTNRDGYRCPPIATLAVPGKQKTASVSRLVYESFYGKLLKSQCISFLDDDCSNGALTNLVIVRPGRRAGQ